MTVSTKRQNRRGTKAVTQGRKVSPIPRPVRPAIDYRRVAAIIRFAADPMRVGVILILNEGIQNVGTMVEMLGSSQPALSHHLAILRHGKIVETERVGKCIFYALTPVGKTLADVVPKLAAW